MSVLFIHSHYGQVPAHYGADPRVTIVRERALASEHFDAARGVITTTHLDQIGWLAHLPALTRLLDRGATGSSTATCCARSSKGSASTCRSYSPDAPTLR